MADAATWRKRVRAWRSAGASASEFASGKGFAATTLKWWAWKLGESRTPASASAPRLVRVVRARGGSSVEHGPSGVMTIEIGVARVSVNADVDRAMLREVLDMLSAISQARP